MAPVAPARAFPHGGNGTGFDCAAIAILPEERMPLVISVLQQGEAPH